MPPGSGSSAAGSQQGRAGDEHSCAANEENPQAAIMALARKLHEESQREKRLARRLARIVRSSALRNPISSPTNFEKLIV